MSRSNLNIEPPKHEDRGIFSWLQMRERFFEGWDEIFDTHVEEIVHDFKEKFDTAEDSEDYIELIWEFSDRWLIEHNYAFYDEIQGILPIKWKSIPREQWGEVPDPFLC